MLVLVFFVTFKTSKKTIIMLPKYLIADNSQELPDSIFVVCTQHPRFIVESDVDDFHSNRMIHWIDQEPDDLSLVDDLMDEAEAFLNSELDNQEDLYDQDE